MKPENTPTILVILGATGDLSRKKLFPALFGLYFKGFMPKHFQILGLSRKDFSDAEFRAIAEKEIALKKNGRLSGKLKNFLRRLIYLKADFGDASSYENLASRLIKEDLKTKTRANKIFYLATHPRLYKEILRNLAYAGLSVRYGAENLVRVLLEKPFGRDLKTARELDRLLGLLFKEEQIFRIDHYLAKEALQNILAFRFSNEIFEPVWNSSHIEKIEVRLYEKSGVGERGNFYDDIGALRDTGQNHILQMLALAVMEHPGAMTADKIRKSRADVFKSLKTVSLKNIKKLVKRGQYAGYLSEKNVRPGSKTETYFKIQAEIKNKRWKGTSFSLESGKKMPENKAEISVYFRKSACLCPPDKERHHQNILTFRIHPDEGIKIIFWAKKPGFDMELVSRELFFSYKDKGGNSEEIPDAYQRVLLDALRGDQMLFAGTEEVEASWKFISSILKNWDIVKLEKY